MNNLLDRARQGLVLLLLYAAAVRFVAWAVGPVLPTLTGVVVVLWIATRLLSRGPRR